MQEQDYKPSVQNDEMQMEGSPKGTPYRDISQREGSIANEESKLVRSPGKRDSVIQQARKNKEKKISHAQVQAQNGPKVKHDFQKKLDAFLESVPVSILMLTITVYALFGDDIRVFSSTKDTDIVFYILTIVCLVFFTIEIILNCIAKPGYLFGFYFWLDLISTITMILDIGWVTQAWFGGDMAKGSTKSIKNIGQASKAGRRASRVIRIIRLVRLIKLYKQANQQYELQQQTKQIHELLQEKQKDEIQSPEISPSRRGSQHQLSGQKTQAQLIQPEKISDEESKFVDFVGMENQLKRMPSKHKIVLPPLQQYQNPQECHSDNRGEEPQSLVRYDKENYANAHQNFNQKAIAEQVKESKVGSTLQELTMKRVITIILSIMISIPIFSYDTYKESLQSYQTGLDRMFIFQGNPQLFNLSFVEFIDYHKEQSDPIVFVYVNQTSDCCDYTSDNSYLFFQEDYPDIDSLRQEDTNLFTSEDSDGNLKAYCFTDNRADNNLNAGLSILRTCFVCALLAFSALIFSKDVSTLILDPIERMIKKVDRIAKNPLEAAQMEEQEELLNEVLQKNNDIAKLNQRQEEQKMETAILEKLIMKIGALLAVGFGEAGSEIIAANMSRGGDVDPMIPGKKMMAIFGFCDIRNFTDATEVLQQGVMVFVNEIAEIVHGTVNHFSGSANKNIGDAFLLVWKFQPEDYGPDENNPSKLKLFQNRKTQQQADLAVLSFLKIITGITISKKLDKYKTHPGLNARLPNYSVKMGFGLHMGWAIEGAIGSNFKIDASYLSPNVNMASRLEAATKQFGSSILISGVLKKYLTEKCQNHLRHIDTVTVKGSLEPVEIHTVDVSFKNLLKEIKDLYDIYDSSQMSKQAKKRYRVLNRIKREELKDKIQKGYDVADEFKTDKELIAIREIFTEQFYVTWKQGFAHYISGNWSEAQKVFKQTIEFIPDHKDGPSNTLLQVIEEHGGKAPSSWSGFRELTEK